MFRGTDAQDREIEQRGFLRRHRGPAIAALAVALGVGLLCASLLHYRGAGASVDAARVTIATVERGKFVRDVGAEGQVVAAVSPTLYASAAGTVTLRVHAGDTVSKGQSLAILDSPDLTAKLAQEDATAQSLRIDWQRARLEADHTSSTLRAALDQAEVDLKTTQRELDRSRKAYELGAFSELQALKAQDALEKAQFAFNQAKSSYEAQPAQNRFEIDSKKALFERQKYVVADLTRRCRSIRPSEPEQASGLPSRARLLKRTAGAFASQIAKAEGSASPWICRGNRRAFVNRRAIGVTCDAVGSLHCHVTPFAIGDID